MESGLNIALDSKSRYILSASSSLNSAPTRLATLGAVAQNLLRSESVASSRIEDVLISHKRLARVAHLGSGARRRDGRAEAVLGNDGNGRSGRALIYAVLRRRGEVARYIPPISLLLAADQGVVEDFEQAIETRDR